MQRERQIAVFLLIFTAVLWSTCGVLIKWVSWHAMAIAGMRSALEATLIPVVVTCSLPALVCVTEGMARERYALPQEIAAAQDKRLEIVGCAALAEDNPFLQP